MPTKIPPADTPDNESISLAKRLRDMNSYKMLLMAKDTNHDGHLSKKEAFVAYGSRLSVYVDAAITQRLEQQAVKPSAMPNLYQNSPYTDAQLTSAIIDKTSATTVRPAMLEVENATIYNEEWIANANTMRSIDFRDALTAVKQAFPKGVEALTVADVLSISPMYQAIPSGDVLIVMTRGGPTI